MTVDQALAALAKHYGILPSFRDLSKKAHPTTSETMKALLKANGLTLDNDAMIREALEASTVVSPIPQEIIIEAGVPTSVELRRVKTWHVLSEDGAEVLAEGNGTDGITLPPLYAGIHELTVQTTAGSDQIALITAPRRTPSVEELTGRSRLWGLNAALYGLRSKRNFGLGDLEDLARAAESVTAHGAGFLGINPIHALGWADNETISPYSPSHRGFLNTLHIAPDRIPGLENSRAAQNLLDERRADFSAPKDEKLIDYARFRRPFASLLKQLFEIFSSEADESASQQFSDFCDDQGKSLSEFALFEALSETHGPDWRRWRDDLRAPDASGSHSAKAGRIRFHLWLQWVATTQLANAQARAVEAPGALGLYLDLAVGPRRGGAETWCEKDSIAQGVSVGAPPDHLSPEGQKWNLAAYAPGKLSRNRYGAFRQVLRAAMRLAGVLRIDHVLGMNRSFWIPDDGSPGGYIRQPFEALLAVIAIEADRARTIVIGEDLGLVPKGFRKAINKHGLYSYSVLQYEKRKDGRFRSPGKLRPQSLACFGTHDTPTVNGFRLGRDIDWWQNLGWIDEDQAKATHRLRRKDVNELLAGSDNNRDPAETVHSALARSPVAIVSVQLDDLAGESEAQNLPGTTDEHPNWQRRCPQPVEGLANWPPLVKAGKTMQAAGRAPCPARVKENAR